MGNKDNFLKLVTWEKQDTMSKIQERIKKREIMEPTFQLKRNGELLFEGTENECYFKLQRIQSQSADWAMKYEGYTITEK